MKVTCGVDIIEITRIKECIETLDNKFLNKIYTEKEIEYCESKKKQKYQHYAARFAAKEAFFKAVSGYLNDKYELSWKDAEIKNDEQGRPYIKLLKEVKKIDNIDVSISHCKDYAIANVIVMSK